MLRSTDNRWLHRFAVLTAVATLALIGIGGLVTSHEAGMAVPDWPTSYGYNMFLFPIGKWWHAGNVFYEHSHRLFASGVGLLTTVLATWLWIKESRRWLRWLGVAAFFGVILQGVLGGLRVVLVRDEIGIFHALVAQLFFVTICSIALVTSRWWNRIDGAQTAEVSRVRYWFLAAAGLILLQLGLGATMRHQHAGLAIPDFPLAYGKLWPATDPQSVLHYNQQRVETSTINPISGFQIQLQMVHRLMAVLIVIAVGACLKKSVKSLGWRHSLSRLALFWAGLIVVQAGLGAATVLSDKAADIATAHVLAGALSLATGALACLVVFQRQISTAHANSTLDFIPEKPCTDCFQPEAAR
jgi:cytochrome c oxidase assembly protein subunit 15